MAPKTRAKQVAAASVSGEEKPYGVRIDTGGHALRGDEPLSQGGGDTGPTPFGLLLTVRAGRVHGDHLADVRRAQAVAAVLG
jgi:hypothetical protein